MITSPDIAELAKALALAQGQMPDALFDRANPFFQSKYATLSAVRSATVPALSAHGLSVLQTTDMDQSELYLYTRLLHASGQWIQGRSPIRTDLSKPQAVGSATTYARRYGWMAICGIASAEDDDDANAAEDAGKTNGNGAPKPIDAEQYRLLQSLIEETKADEEKLLAYLKADDLHELNQAQYKIALAALKKKVANATATNR